MALFRRDDILSRLRAKVAAGQPIIGGGAGTGISAKMSEAGGVDLLVIYNSGRFRMAVDRSLILHGIGVVVTGSVHAGIAGCGDAVTVAPGGLRARLRGLRIHDRDVSSVRAGDRCAG